MTISTSTTSTHDQTPAKEPYKVTLSTSPLVDRAVTFTDQDGDRHELIFHNGVFVAAFRVPGFEWQYAPLPTGDFGGYPETDEAAIAFGEKYAQSFRDFLQSEEVKDLTAVLDSLLPNV